MSERVRTSGRWEEMITFGEEDKKMAIIDRYEIRKIDGARAQIIDLETDDHVLEIASTDLTEEEIYDLLEPMLNGLNEHDEQ